MIICEQDGVRFSFRVAGVAVRAAGGAVGAILLTGAAAAGGTVTLISGTTYLPLTDGRRNELADRVLIMGDGRIHEERRNAQRRPAREMSW